MNEIHYFQGGIKKEKAGGACAKCSKWHHWMHTKTIADIVEVLIGAYLVAGLLLEAFTHPLYNEQNGGCFQVLGDLVELFAGALLIDDGFDLEYVWKLMLNILEPIVTPETLCLQPAYGIVHPNKILETSIKTCHKKDPVLIGIDKTERWTPEIMITEKHQASNSKTSDASFSHTCEMMRMFSKDPAEINLDTVPSPQENTSTEHESHPTVLPTLEENNTSSTVQNEVTKQNTLSSSFTVQTITAEDEQSDNRQYTELASISSEYQSASVKHSTDNFQYLGSAISSLHEFCQKIRWESPIWSCYKEEGLPHNRRLPGDTSVECVGKAMRSKKLAMGSAACGALWWLNSEGYLKEIDLVESQFI